MGNVHIRLASIADIGSIQTMADNVFRHTYRNIITPEQMEFMMEWMYSTDSLTEQMNNGHIYSIISADGQDVGYVSINKEQEGEDGTTLFHLQKIYVLPEMQGNGLGAKLLLHAEEQMLGLTDGGRVRYELNVNRNNKAVDFYKRMGMHKDRTGDFPIGNGFYMNDYIMAKEISKKA